MSFNFSKLSILVVEDTKPMRDLIVSVFETLEIGNIFTAVNGEEGFEVFVKKRPDIVFIDWDMPVENGIRLTKRIRTDPMSTDRTVPVVMVSGYSAAQRVREARDAGVTEFLVKPFTANDVAKRLAYVINKPRDFIEVEDDYTGPDRRRKSDDSYKGPERRKDD